MPFGGLLTAGVSAGSSLISGLFGGKAAKKAAKQQGDATLHAIGIQGDQLKKNVDDIWTSQGWANNAITDAVKGGQEGIDAATGQARGDVAAGVADANDTLAQGQKDRLSLYNPYIDVGTSSLNSLKDLASSTGPLADKFSFGQKDLDNDSGYNFTLKQGQEALQKNAAVHGGLFSSGTLKSLAGFTTGTANTYFNDAFSRAKSTFDTNQTTAINRIGTLRGLAGMGYDASNASSGVIGDTTGRQSQNTLQGSEFGANLSENAAQENARLGLSGGSELSRNTMLGSQARTNLGTNYANNVGNLLVGKGNTDAAATVGSTNGWLSALNNTTNATLNYLAGRPNNNNTGPAVVRPGDDSQFGG